MSNDQKPVLYCFKNDLRLSDNPGLTAAIETGRPVVTCFILDQQTAGDWAPGSASLWWLHHSLDKLQQSLDGAGGRLILRSGVWEKELDSLAREVDAAAVYWAHAPEPHEQKGETSLHKTLEERDVESRRFNGYLLYAPDAVKTQSGTPYKVFSPFWKSCLELDDPKQPLDPPKSITAWDGDVDSEELEDWKLLPTKPDWAGGMREMWEPGEEGAHKRLKAFLKNAVKDYRDARDNPGVDGTSRLSPHLHFGEISPRQVWHAAQDKMKGDTRKGAEWFLRELGWREFSYHLLQHWPTLPHKAFREKYEDFPWGEDKDALKAWQRGQTGVPLVDAGMRQLWHIGWMHNRVRMIVASFLIKNLLIHWREGEDWFWDTLVDANLGNNAASWQWVAGSGADAAPYFRIFNPVSQGEKHDPNGDYIRKWVPEIANLSDKYIHEPWEASEEVLKSAGIQLGKHYPQPVVDLRESRERALEAYQEIKSD